MHDNTLIVTTDKFTKWAEKLTDYYPIVVFFCIAVTVAWIMAFIPEVLANFKYNESKLDSYECGFEPFSDSRKKFDIRFYLVAIIFVLFDLEIALITPWIVEAKLLGPETLLCVSVFITMVVIGFWYEWTKKSLDW